MATPGERQGERGLLGAPSISLRVTPWFEYVVEGHVARYVRPVSGNMAGVVPLGWRIHARGRSQPYLSMGAGLVWTDFTGLRGIDQQRNYLTQIGAGVRRLRTDGSVVSVEARFFHLSNLSSAPPNLGMEVFAVLVGYRPAAHDRRDSRR
ncbi:MAG: acyloxyacyl hydrolase [Acidobacteria bacterium]|nr:acyloxyacyl hydrolase [Acidobacteriota bacterium]